jgi:hypothetical protein
MLESLEKYGKISLSFIGDIICNPIEEKDKTAKWDLFNRNVRQIVKIAAVALLAFATSYSIPFTLTVTACFMIGGGGILGAVVGKIPLSLTSIFGHPFVAVAL